MGGHMRSHFCKLPIPPKPKPTNHGGPKPPSSSSSVLSFPVDRQSDTESPRNPTRRRSKRLRKSVSKLVQSLLGRESVSSVSQTFSDIEEVAMCLLMLSKDKWVEEEVDDEDDDDVDDGDDDGYESSCVNGVKFRCETCKKRFTSYQALAGHRASHKNKNKKVQKEEKMNVNGEGKKLFKCPLCSKVFKSGQALGGHKKVHFSYLNISKSCNHDDHDEVSQVELSSICNTDMCDPVNTP
ncbi:zinc finger protein ZAT1-like [Carica papaya]|uniref:zinc finger protein ZAT1-like n=1 Tax=Carica papaya TaxID=3649 RepID=UPI000B8CC679|nr:zinc finger protein ZAT1-like [Carica papaya]